VTQPAANHVDFDASFEQVDRSRVPKHVRRNGARRARRFVEKRPDNAPNDLVDPEPRQVASLAGYEHGFLWRSTSHQRAKQRHGFRPEGAGPPFVAFAVEMCAGLFFEFEVLDPEFGYLLDASACIVQEKEQRSVPQSQGSHGR